MNNIYDQIEHNDANTVKGIVKNVFTPKGMTPQKRQRFLPTIISSETKPIDVPRRDEKFKKNAIDY